MDIDKFEDLIIEKLVMESTEQLERCNLNDEEEEYKNYF